MLKSKTKAKTQGVAQSDLPAAVDFIEIAQRFLQRVIAEEEEEEGGGGGGGQTLNLTHKASILKPFIIPKRQTVQIL
jgi:hypothetical protein